MIVLAFTFPVSALAQGAHPSVIEDMGAGAPSGSCHNQSYVDSSTGIMYVCKGGTWFNPSVATTSINNAVLYAADYSGADAGAKIQACINGLPSTGGTCDARGITGAQSMASSISLGSDTKSVKLLLGSISLTRAAAASFLYFAGTQVIGSLNGVTSASTIINSSDGTAVFVYGGSGTPANVNIKDLRIIGDNVTGDGQIGIDFTKTLASSISNVSMANIDIGLFLGGTVNCACYDYFENLAISALTAAARFGSNANSNVWMGGRPWASAAAGIGLDLTAGGYNVFVGPDIENTFEPVHIGSGVSGNFFLSTYMEASGNVVIDATAHGNTFVGGTMSDSTFTDNSGNVTNFRLGASESNGNPGAYPPMMGASTYRIGKDFTHYYADITSGSGAPTGACHSGNVYLNNTGGAGSTLYVCESGAWVAK